VNEQQKEQQKLRAELIERFGVVTFTRALEMSGIRTCLQALATGNLSELERNAAYTMASMHLAKWQATYITTEESAKLTECAKRIDAAMEVWTLDDIERRDGLQADEMLRARGKVPPA
jgi:hypothetical protein